jgi:hypothetical protein
MERFHYLGKGPLCGAQIRYLVESSRCAWIGAIAFSAAQWRLKERDQYIGCAEAARRANLHLVVCNSRFLILPGVQVPNLASRGQMLGGSPQTMSVPIVEERQRRRCPCGAGTQRAHGGLEQPLQILGQAPR